MTSMWVHGGGFAIGAKRPHRPGACAGYVLEKRASHSVKPEFCRRHGYCIRRASKAPGKPPVLPQRICSMPSECSDSSGRRLLGAVSVAVFFVVLAASTPAAACPGCADGQAARREVIADGFLRNLATSLLPFLIVGAVSAGTHAIGRSRAPESAGREGS
jgi:hypothetical protein